MAELDRLCKLFPMFAGVEGGVVLSRRTLVQQDRDKVTGTIHRHAVCFWLDEFLKRYDLATLIMMIESAYQYEEASFTVQYIYEPDKFNLEPKPGHAMTVGMSQGSNAYSHELIKSWLMSYPSNIKAPKNYQIRFHLYERRGECNED